jgi:epoxide hydrolase
MKHEQERPRGRHERRCRVVCSPAHFSAAGKARARCDTPTRSRAIQATRPKTLAYGLTDSPIGQLAWIVEKFKEWVDPAAARPEDAIDRDHILTNVSLIWFTATAGSSANLYYETLHDPLANKRKRRNSVPTGVAVSLTQDVTIRRWAERENNIVHWTEFEHGGHFAALEAPEFLIRDIRQFFRQVRTLD